MLVFFFFITLTISCKKIYHHLQTTHGSAECEHTSDYNIRNSHPYSGAGPANLPFLPRSMNQVLATWSYNMISIRCLKLEPWNIVEEEEEEWLRSEKPQPPQPWFHQVSGKKNRQVKWSVFSCLPEQRYTNSFVSCIFFFFEPFQTSSWISLNKAAVCLKQSRPPYTPEAVFVDRVMGS